MSARSFSRTVMTWLASARKRFSDSRNCCAAWRRSAISRASSAFLRCRSTNTDTLDSSTSGTSGLIR